jgi:hypothetical protein
MLQRFSPCRCLQCALVVKPAGKTELTLMLNLFNEYVDVEDAKSEVSYLRKRIFMQTFHACGR